MWAGCVPSSSSPRPSSASLRRGCVSSCLSPLSTPILPPENIPSVQKERKEGRKEGRRQKGKRTWASRSLLRSSFSFSRRSRSRRLSSFSLSLAFRSSSVIFGFLFDVVVAAAVAGADPFGVCSAASASSTAGLFLPPAEAPEGTVMAVVVVVVVAEAEATGTTSFVGSGAAVAVGSCCCCCDTAMVVPSIFFSFHSALFSLFFCSLVSGSIELAPSLRFSRASDGAQLVW